MSQFVGYDATQNYVRVELGVLSQSKTCCIVVVDTCQNRADRKTEDVRLEIRSDGRRKYAQHDVGRLEWSQTGSSRTGGDRGHRTFQPDDSHARNSQQTGSDAESYLADVVFRKIA